MDCEIYPVISQGFVYGLNQSPTTEDNTVTTYAINNEHIEITGLEEDTTYYVRTYLTNSLGTFYGNEISFETPYNDAVPVITIIGEGINQTAPLVFYQFEEYFLNYLLPYQYL